MVVESHYQLTPTCPAREGGRSQVGKESRGGRKETIEGSRERETHPVSY